eukprot:TRINITY_DN92991_c0_g1_i1.p1 TRINITY_DN92991_c0_g1~~TRINITY_DN92991_c0_g1_i1.p1  ORF type:complete len:187 (+),score=25.32 TRINITY_DN92991_c0_g1_i1:29-589(+)
MHIIAAWAANCAFSGLCYTGSDLACQGIEVRFAKPQRQEKPEAEEDAAQHEISLVRAVRFSVSGVLGTAGYFWYLRALEHFIPGHSAGAVIAKTAVDQAWCTLSYTAVLLFNTLLADGDLGLVLRTDAPRVWLMSLVYWVPMDLLQFSVDVDAQAAFSALGDCLFMIGVSYFANRHLLNRGCEHRG